MRKMCMVLIVLLGVAPMVNAVNIGGSDMGVTADVTFMSRYIWRGYNLMGSSPVWQPSVDFDLGGGFGANIWAAYAHNAGHVNATEYNYTLYYGGTMLDDCFKTDYAVGWRYYDFIDMPSKGVDAQELFLEMQMPQLVGGGFVPKINYYYLWQARSGRNSWDPTQRVKSGSIVQAGFDYNFVVPEMPEAPMTFSWDLTYNDGAASSDMTHDFTHMTWGLSSAMQCPMTGGTITPQLYYQNTFVKHADMNLPKKDFLYCGLSYTLKF